MRIIALMLLLCSAGYSQNLSNCESLAKILEKDFFALHLSQLSLSNSNGIPQSFDTARWSALNSSRALVKCLSGKEYNSDLVEMLVELIESLENFTETKGTDTAQIQYSQLRWSVEKYQTFKFQYDTRIILDTVKSDMVKLVNGVKSALDNDIKKLDSSIQSLSSLPEKINAHTDSQLSPIKTDLQTIKNKLTVYVPLYVGVQLNPENGLGFTGHYHFRQDKEVGVVTSAAFLHKVDTASIRHYGGSLGAGLSIGLHRPQNHVALLGEWVGIHKSQFGWRLMAYNRQMAVGIGYSKYMGTGVSLLIAFQDFGKKK